MASTEAVDVQNFTRESDVVFNLGTEFFAYILH
jgi:hypothetical protein